MDIKNTFLPAWSHGLQCLKSILNKAEQHAEAQGYDAEVLLNTRLAPDMFPMIKQVQIACDLVARAGARLSGSELPSYPDNETSFAELRQRIDSVLDYVAGLDAAGFEGAAQREVEIPVGGGNTQAMPGGQYVFSFVIPNLYFHLTTAYNLLRHNGVPLGKRDFLLPG